MRTLKDMLQFEAKRKPHIAELINKLHEITDEEIDALKLPLPWYKKALKEYRKEITKQDEYAASLARILPNIHDGVVPDNLGTIKKWNGGNQFIDVDRGQIELKSNDLIWFPDYGGVWIDTLYSKKIDQKLSNSIFVSKASKSEYTEKCWEKRNSSLAQKVSVAPDNIVRQTPLFTIYK